VPVVFAIRRGDVKAINDLATSAPLSLLKENNDGWIPLHDAAICGQTECLKIILRGMALKALLKTVLLKSHGLRLTMRERRVKNRFFKEAFWCSGCTFSK